MPESARECKFQKTYLVFVGEAGKIRKKLPKGLEGKNQTYFGQKGWGGASYKLREEKVKIWLEKKEAKGTYSKKGAGSVGLKAWWDVIPRTVVAELKGEYGKSVISNKLMGQWQMSSQEPSF